MFFVAHRVGSNGWKEVQECRGNLLCSKCAVRPYAQETLDHFFECVWWNEFIIYPPLTGKMKVKKATWQLDREYKNSLRCRKGEISPFLGLDDKSLNYMIEFFCKDFSNTVSFMSARSRREYTSGQISLSEIQISSQSTLGSA